MLAAKRFCLSLRTGFRGGHAVYRSLQSLRAGPLPMEPGPPAALMRLRQEGLRGCGGAPGLPAQHGGVLPLGRESGRRGCVEQRELRY